MGDRRVSPPETFSLSATTATRRGCVSIPDPVDASMAIYAGTYEAAVRCIDIADSVRRDGRVGNIVVAGHASGAARPVGRPP